jgi:hypothetical protein
MVDVAALANQIANIQNSVVRNNAQSLYNLAQSNNSIDLFGVLQQVLGESAGIPGKIGDILFSRCAQ